MGRFLFGLIIGILAVPLAVLLYLKFGHVPVAVNDRPFPEERLVTSVPLEARIDRDMMRSDGQMKGPPIQPDEAVFVAGAHVYAENCAVCHGFHGKPSKIGLHEFPTAPPLWEKHRNGNVVGVSDDPPGETYWKVSNGIRLTGMPAYKETLSDMEMWQVSLLLANADKPLPPAALAVLSGETSPTPADSTAPAPAPNK